MRFKNPKNGETVDFYDPLWLLVLFLNFFYFFYKKSWINFAISFVILIFSGGASWLLYPLFAKPLIKWEYRQRGWLSLDDGFGDVEINGMYSRDISIIKTNLSEDYSKIAVVSAIVYKKLPSSPEPTEEAVNEKLQHEALKLGANAVINTRYERKKTTWVGWGSLVGHGWAVKIHK